MDRYPSNSIQPDSHRVSALAGATVGNQPTYDRGGICLKVQRVIRGVRQPWETFFDEVTITATDAGLQAPRVSLTGSTGETDAPPLPQEPSANMAGRAVMAALRLMENRGFPWHWHLTIDVRKGFSLKGTGIGSSGASAAAALKALEALLPELGIPVAFSEKEKMHILQEADNGVPDNSIAAYFGGWVAFDSANPEVLQRVIVHPSFGGFVLACPRGFGMITAEARAVVPRKPPTDQDDLVARMFEALKRGESGTYGKLMEQAHAWFVTPRTHLYPREGAVYWEIHREALAAGAAGVTIAGAGPGILAVSGAPDAADAVGEAMYAACRRMGFDAVTYLAGIDTTGARAISPASPAVP